MRSLLYVVDTTEENLEQVYTGLGEAAAAAGAKATTMTLRPLNRWTGSGRVVMVWGP